MMMKQLILILMAAFFCGSVWGQCPQGGVTFYTQDDINDFISTYPNCTEIQGSVTVDCIFLFDGINSLNGLRNIVNIANSLIIRDCDLTSLSGLSYLNTIGNDLKIENNDALTSLTGLGELVSVGRDLIVENNTNLISLAGLESLEAIGQDFNIWENSDLVNLTGLENLSSVGRNFWIYENNSLSSLTGLGSLNSIGMDINVWNNYNLTTLTGLENLVSIGEDLLIQGNEALTTLMPLGNLNSIGGRVLIFESDISTLEGLGNVTSIPGGLSISKNYNLTTLTGLESLNSIGGLDIRNNYDLAICNIPSICNYLENGGTATIYSNSPGCDSQVEIQTACASTTICPQGDVIIWMQSEVDNFILTYPTCTELPGNLYIGDDLGGSDIENLDGLANITTIAGDLWISQNYGLATLNGLQNLSTINGYLYINENTSLTSIEGLENLDPATITNLTIRYNSNLSTCDVNSICNYLEGGGTANISANDPGCNSQAEIQTTCTSNTTCPQGDITLYLQSEVDNFILTYPACTELLGNLYIGDDLGGSDIENLDGLAYINRVAGDLWISRNYELTTLNGLQSLSTINGYLYINENTSLASLEGLENLDPATITNLTITHNSNLSICDANSICNYLEGSGTANISANASGCNSQAEIQAACTYVPPCPQGDVIIWMQSEVDNFILAYPECTELPGNLYIGDDFGDSDIDNLDGLANITAIAGDLWISRNYELTTLNGLQNLSTINGYLYINENTSLTSIESLENLDPATITNLTIRYNSNLSTCDVNSICNYLEGGGTANISANDPGCNSQAEIEAECNPIPPNNPCDGTVSTNSLTHIFDQDLFIDGIGFANNPNITFTDPGTPTDAVLSDISLELYFRLNGSSCEDEIAIQLTDPAGNTQALTAYTTCDGGTGLYYVNLDVPSGNTTGSVADWLVEFDDTNDQNTDYEYSVRFARLNYVATTVGGTSITNEVSEIADNDLFIDGIGFANNGNYTFTDPGTPTDAVLSDISLELYFRLNGASCENEIAIQITDPAGNTQALTAYTTCDGGTGLYYVNLDVPSGNTTGNVADWTVQFDDTNDQNTDYEYSVRFGRLTYTTTLTTDGGGTSVTINEEVSEFADADLFIDAVGFANNDSYTFTDPGTPTDAILSNISLELYFRLNGSSCENEIAIQITDPAGNTQPLTAYTTCDGGTGLYYVNLDVPSGSTTGSVADWMVEFDDTNDQNSDYEYSVRFGRLTYTTQYDLCDTQMMIVEENEASQELNNSSTQKIDNSSTRQLINSLKLYPVPASQYLNVEYFSEKNNSTNIEIISNEGKTLVQQEASSQEGINTIQLDINDLPAGHYHIRMYSADDVHTQSFIKIAP